MAPLTPEACLNMPERLPDTCRSEGHGTRKEPKERRSLA